jgi:hypothetical protein
VRSSTIRSSTVNIELDAIVHQTSIETPTRLLPNLVPGIAGRQYNVSNSRTIFERLYNDLTVTRIPTMWVLSRARI